MCFIYFYFIQNQSTKMLILSYTTTYVRSSKACDFSGDFKFSYLPRLVCSSPPDTCISIAYTFPLCHPGRNPLYRCPSHSHIGSVHISTAPSPDQREWHLTASWRRMAHRDFHILGCSIWKQLMVLYLYW